jgi:circadian clock protein KaiC
MTKKTGITRMATGVRNLDEILGGGWPVGSVTVIAGPPGSGKTVLAHQICFHNASLERRVLYFNTLSEPSAKTLRYLAQFNYFDAKKLEKSVWFVDLGSILRINGLEQAQELIMQHLKKIKPGIVVVDSFKVFDDLSKSREELRKFGYEIAVKLMAWETTAFLLGEYGMEDVATNPLFSIVDGLVTLAQRESSGEQQRFFQIVKMRGTEHSRDEHAFVITSNGIDIYAPRLTLQRKPLQEQKTAVSRCRTGISRLDDLLGDGIPHGSSLLISGVAGTGKTVLLLEFIYRGALAGEKGIVFSFEETEERLRASARGLGWNLDQEIKRGTIEIVFIPQPNILVEGHLLMMKERIESMSAKRVAVDSVSVFLHKINDPYIAREKIFQLASIVQNVQAVAFFATDIPYGLGQISRFGVEETVVDGVILLTSKEEGFNRERYIEIYKLRNTAHLKGRHNLLIEKGGIAIFPRYIPDVTAEDAPPSVDIAERIPSGTPGLDGLLGGGLLRRSITLVSGSAGIGKSTLGMQFLIAGAKHRETGIYVTVEEGQVQILNSADALGLPLKKAVNRGLVEIVYLSRERVRAAQFASILTSKINEAKAQRLVLDSASHIVAGMDGNDEMRELLYKLAVRLKALGVTSIFTLESKSMFSIESVTGRDFSPIADNLLMLRYVMVEGAIKPTLTVVKTRGTQHDRDTHLFEIAKGGLRVGHVLGQPGGSGFQGTHSVDMSAQDEKSKTNEI